MRDLQNDARRNHGLDGLRAIAALSVLVHHLSGGVFFPLGDLGRFGVMLFFVISGYCIVMSVQGARGGLRQFVIRRGFRLYPAYWISISLVAMSGAIPWTTVLVNLTMVQRLFGVPDISGVYWTLFVEILFYGGVCVMLAVKAVTLRSFALSWLALTALALAASVLRLHGLSVPYAHLLFLSVFAMGGTIYLAAPGRAASQLLWLACGVYLAVVMVVSRNVFGDAGVGTETALSHFGNYAGATLMFLLWRHTGWFSWRWLAYLGRISYCIYLFHPEAHRLAMQLTEVEPAVAAAATMLCVAFSAMVHHWVEQPCIRWGKAWARRWSSS